MLPVLSLQLCVWSTDGWEKQSSTVLQIPTGRAAAALSDTRVQFHLDQIHLLVVHESQIAIYEAPKLECLKQVGLTPMILYQYLLKEAPFTSYLVAFPSLFELIFDNFLYFFHSGFIEKQLVQSHMLPTPATANQYM